jgi:hypothetical protein
MITTSTSPFLYIDRGKGEPGMTLQCWDGEWVDYKINGRVVKSPLDIDTLPFGKYRLVDYSCERTSAISRSTIITG